MAELFTEVYNLLPLAHVINGKILVSLHIISVIKLPLVGYFMFEVGNGVQKFRISYHRIFSVIIRI